MFGNLKLFVGILQIGGYIVVNNANPVTNFDPSRVSSLSASGRSYGDSSSSANGRILSQPSIPDKDAITYPDDVIRDSYGNIVTPYTTLLEDSASYQSNTPKPLNLGHHTDVSKDNGQQLQFVIPSYSDGITELQGPYKPSAAQAAQVVVAPPLLTLLPPLSSGNYNYPSLDTQKSSVASVDNSYQNEVGSIFSSSAAQNINPNPVPTGPTSITTNGHIGSANDSPSIYAPGLQVPFSSPSATPNQPILPTSYQPQTGINAPAPTSYQPQTGINTQALAQPSSGTPTSTQFSKPGSGFTSDFSTIHVSSSESDAPTASFSFANTKPLKDTQFVNQVPINIQVDSGKYTGGFGGAPGILGEQKQPGYAVKPTTTANKPALSASPPQISNDHPVLNSVLASSPTNSPNYGTQTAVPTSQQAVLPNENLQAPPAKTNNINQSAHVGQSTTTTNHGSFQFGTSFAANPTPTTSQVGNNNKYTGGFGGPPGIYSPYDNTAKTDNGATSSTGPKRKY